MFSPPSIRFGYDALSLKVLGDEGVISCLTDILNDYNAAHRHTHNCDDDDSKAAADVADCPSLPPSPSTPCRGSASPAASVCSSGLSDVEMLDESDTEPSRAPPPPPPLPQPPNPSTEDERKIIDCALQFLLRVFEIQLPADEMAKADNVKAIVRYICWTESPSSRAGNILVRISK